MIILPAFVVYYGKFCEVSHLLFYILKVTHYKKKIIILYSSVKFCRYQHRDFHKFWKTISIKFVDPSRSRLATSLCVFVFKFGNIKGFFKRSKYSWKPRLNKFAPKIEDISLIFAPRNFKKSFSNLNLSMWITLKDSIV